MLRHKLPSIREYKISIVGLAIILVVFAAVLPYSLRVPRDSLIVLTSIALMGAALGLLAGPPKLDVELDMNSLLYGLLGFSILGITSLNIGVIESLSIHGYVYIVAAVCEELAFRFGIQRFAEKVMGPLIALIFQAGLFMLYHWMVYPGYSLLAAYPLIAGLVLGAVNMLAKDLTAPLIAHVLNNALVILLT